jgi:capsular exopolysaccharide synthesis family protein
LSQGSADAAIKSTEVPGLFLLPCGPIPPNPAELLHTQAFADLLGQLAGKYDRVILDSPPLGAVADAVVLATRADGFLLVVKAAHTSKDMAKRAVRAIRDVNAKMLGAILNNINLDDPKYGDYYYYAYRQYGAYYGDKKDEAAQS